MRSSAPRRSLRAATTGLAALGLVLVPLAPGALAVGAVPAAAPAGTSVTLFNINDFHGRISTTAKPLACTLTDERRTLGDGGNSVFLSAGDNVGASEFASYIQDDDPTIDYLNALQLKASALGNHEYDKGQDDLKGHIEERADWEYLAANIFTTEGERAATPSTIVDAGTVKVAVVGADTQETPALTSPAGLTGLEFRDPVSSVNEAITELEAAKATGDSKADYDIVVVEYHEGSARSAAAGTNPGGGELYQRIVNDTSPAADVIFNGHTHQSYTFQAPVPGEPGESRPIMQTGSYGANLGKVTLSVDAAGDWDAVPAGTGLVATPKEVAAGSPCTTDPVYQAAAKISDDAKAKGDIEAAKPVGSISEDITTAYAPSDAAYGADGTWESTGTVAKGDDRASSSTLSNALADSMVWATQRDSYAGAKASIGVMNPGGVRADLFHARSGAETADGQVTFGEANNVVPFVNNLSTVKLTGAQFVKLLNQQWQRDAAGEVPSRDYLALGLSKNVDYTFDASLPEGQRITSVTIDGEPLDPAATYTVVAANFLTAGGDNFRAFTEGTDVTDTGLLDRDAWIDYLADGAQENLAPDFSQRGIGFSIADPDAAGTEADPWRITLSTLESRSLGAPRVDSVSVTIDGRTTTAPYTQDAETGQWSATLDLAVPQCLPTGVHDVTVTATPDTGTAVSRQLEVTAGGDCTAAPTPSAPAPTTSAPAPSPSSSSAAVPTSTGTPSGSTAAGAPSRLPRTGTEAAPYVAAAAALVVLGIGALAIRRRLRG